MKPFEGLEALARLKGPEAACRVEAHAGSIFKSEWRSIKLEASQRVERANGRWWR